jgi:hypothetical protein
MRIAAFNRAWSLSFAQTAAALGFACAASLAAQPAGAQGTPEQRQACQPDAMRLCGEFVPDVERITACMVKNRIRLSAPCRVYFVEPRKGKPFKRPE